jgi:protein-tyrosine phosphatase
MGNLGPVRDDAHRFSPAAPDEQYVYGSCCPGWHAGGDHQTALDRWISFMQSEGIERVCCLMAGRHLDDQEANVAKYEEAFGAENVRHTPVPDRQLVDADRLRTEILPFIEAGVEAGQPVVVHCLSGVCRTGQVLAAWLVYGRGYAPTEAVDTVLEMGRDPTAAVDHGNATRAELFEVFGTLVDRSDDC